MGSTIVKDKFDFREMDKRTIQQLLTINGRLTKGLRNIANMHSQVEWEWCRDYAQEVLDNAGKDV